MFVGAVSDNFDERIDQKIFHAEIVVDSEAVKKETASYQPIPVITDFKDDTPNKMKMKLEIQRNYDTIKQDVIDIVKRETERIASDPKLRHLLDMKPR